MKIKTNLVTNSSSASFIMYVESNTDNLTDFQTDFEKFLEKYKKDYYYDSDVISSLKFINPKSIEQISTHVFAINEWTSMHNNYDDIPHYMRHLMILSFCEGTEEFGFTITKFKIKDES